MLEKKLVLCYLFFLATTSIRFVLENLVASLPTIQFAFFHHHYWFLFVFFLFLLHFRLFLKMEIEEMTWIFFLSPIIFIPIIFHVLSGNDELRLHYINGKDFLSNFKDIFTFMLSDSNNRPISIELIVIFLSIAIFSFYKSRKIALSFFIAFSCYLSLIILGGTAIISPYEEEALLFVKTSMDYQLFMLYLYLSASAITLFCLFYKEIFSVYNNLSLKKTSTALFFFVFLFFVCIFFTLLIFFKKDFFVGDIIIIIIPSVIVSQTLAVFFYFKKRKNIFIKTFLSFHSIVILMGLLMHILV